MNDAERRLTTERAKMTRLSDRVETARIQLQTTQADYDNQKSALEITHTRTLFEERPFDRANAEIHVTRRGFEIDQKTKALTASEGALRMQQALVEELAAGKVS
jgi:hypothetical protein